MPSDTNPAQEFLSVDEAAELLRVNRKTLYKAIEEGEIPGVLKVGRSIRISRIHLLGLPGLGDLSLKESKS
jgi:excisionase family DNA binding protein